MSRRRANRADAYRRDASDITRSPVDLDDVYTYRDRNPSIDRRFFNPNIRPDYEPDVKPRSLVDVRRSTRKLVRDPSQGYDIFNAGHYLVHPRETVICLRRKIRREVLFARGGSGGGKRKKPRYNADSAIKCRR